MTGDSKLIDKLHYLLAGELTAINQYMVHAEMCENWGYDKLHKIAERRAISEMKHAEKLIARILFLEGKPKVSVLNQVFIGEDIPAQLGYDHTAESNTIRDYNEAIILAGEVKDYATKSMLQEILNDEDAHIDQIEELQDQVNQMSLQIFLSTQTDEK